MSKALEGVRILDMGHVQAAPTATQLLAWMGADVIKVEMPGRGDITRGQLRDVKGVDSLYFTMLNSNKRSITLNLKSPGGKKILEDMIRQCDVMVENFGPGVLDRQGFTWERIHEINPRIVYASIKGFGPGRYADFKAYENVAQCMGGAASTTGWEDGPPTVTGAQIGDSGTGVHLIAGILGALFQRERTGRGQHIDLAMLGVAMMMQASLITGYFRTGTEPKPHGNKQPYATNSAYDAREGMVMIGASNLRQQARFWRAVKRPDMIKTDNEARIADREREAANIADIIKTRTADEWEVYFQARHVPAARVRTMAEALADPHFETRRVFHKFERAPGVEGSFAVPLAAFKFAHGGPSIETPPPVMGADTEPVLVELGYTQAEIAELHAARVI